MIRPWVFGILAGAAAFALCRKSSRTVPVRSAAEQLRQAWADHRTVA